MVPAVLLAAGPAASGWRGLALGLGVDPAPQSGPAPDPVSTGLIRAVGVERLVSPEAEFWADGTDGLLFSFHLHSFSELARYAASDATYAGERFWVALIRSWLETCGRPGGSAWHPFPTSGRVVAWCAALSRGDWPSELASTMRASLARQLILLRRSVEHDIGGNHVLRNATALIIGGACLEDASGLRRGLSELELGLERQLLADGGHEERSPSYHRAVLADLRDTATLLGRVGTVPAWLEAAIKRMSSWLAALAGPDGKLPLLNDSWEGPAVVERPVEPLTDLAASGYVVRRWGDDQAVLDVGIVAPPHLPPHAHADVGSFVLWMDGRPIVVDPGTYSYSNPDRAWFRGTAAHATLEVDGADQFDGWRPFRAAFMPSVRRFNSAGSEGINAVEHDGYRRLSDPAIHRRTFLWIPGGGLVVLDRLIARRSHVTMSRLPLAPGTSAMQLAVDVTALGVGFQPEVEAARYSPWFGRQVPVDVIVRRAVLEPGDVTGWALLRRGFTARLTDRHVRVMDHGVVVAEATAA